MRPDVQPSERLVIVGIPRPVRFDIRPVQGPAPPGDGCAELGAFIGGVFVSRFIVPSEFAEPLGEALGRANPVILCGAEESPGGSVRANLLGLIGPDRVAEEGEPWNAGAGDAEHTPVTLGLFRRLPVERRFPGSLHAELADLFHCVMAGEESGFLDAEFRAAGL
jgi:hypothetical protein